MLLVRINETLTILGKKRTPLITACVNYLKALTMTQYSVCVDPLSYISWLGLL